MNDITYDIKNLSKEEIITILECLLFSSSTDVCASWYKENVDTMLSLTKKIRLKIPQILTENVYIFTDNENCYEDASSKDTLKIFPELIKQKI